MPLTNLAAVAVFPRCASTCIRHPRHDTRETAALSRGERCSSVDPLQMGPRGCATRSQDDIQQSFTLSKRHITKHTNSLRTTSDTDAIQHNVAIVDKTVERAAPNGRAVFV